MRLAALEDIAARVNEGFSYAVDGDGLSEIYAEIGRLNPRVTETVSRLVTGAYDLTATHPALKSWSDRCTGSNAPELEAALADIGARSYREQKGEAGGRALLSAAFQSERDRRLAVNRAEKEALLPLNPG